MWSAAALPLSAFALSDGESAPAVAAADVRICVIGGGMGGGYAARLLRRMLPAARITIIEKAPRYCAVAWANHVIAGLAPMAATLYGYDNMIKAGIEVIHAEATAVESDHVALNHASIKRAPFDIAVVAPGIGFDYARMPGYGYETRRQTPHGFAGEAQVRELRRQVAALRNGDTMMIIPSPSPSRCSPAAYSRAGLLADYARRNLPDSRILIFDNKENFALQTYFDDGWAARHRDRIEWFSADAGGLVEAIDADNNIARAEFGDESAALINYIPPQNAGALAAASGLIDDSGWCAVEARTMESRRRRGVYVVGDAVSGGRMPKAGAVAMSQARVAAAAIVGALGGGAESPANIAYQCFSYVAADYGFWEKGVYVGGDDGVFDNAELAFSARDADAATRRAQAADGERWFVAAMREIFG